MFEKEYKAIFDQVQPSRSIKAETEELIMSHYDGKKKRMPAAIAVVLAVLLVGTAVAATLQSNILTRIFGSKEPSPEAVASVIRDAGQAADSGVQLVLNEYLVDQNTLNLSWSVSLTENEDVYYVTWAEIDDNGLTESDESKGYVEGSPYGGSDESIGDGAIVHLTPEEQAYTSWASFGWAHGIDRSLTAKIHVHAFVSSLTPEKTKYSASELCYAEPNDEVYNYLKALENANSLGIAADLPLCYVNSYEAYQEALGDGCESSEICAALEKSGLFQPLKELVIEVEIDPTSISSAYSMPSELTFELPGREVILKTMQFNTVSTFIQYDVIVYDAAEVDPAYSWYLVADADGNVKNVEWGLSLSSSGTEVMEGNTIIHYSLASEAPVTELPSSLTFIPVDRTERYEGEAPVNYWQRVADNANATDCFTVNIK